MSFKADCLKYRGRPLTGKYAHACPDWDGLPIDETCPEWDCLCDILLPDNSISYYSERKTNKNGA